MCLISSATFTWHCISYTMSPACSAAGPQQAMHYHRADRYRRSGLYGLSGPCQVSAVKSFGAGLGVGIMRLPGWQALLYTAS